MAIVEMFESEFPVYRELLSPHCFAHYLYRCADNVTLAVLHVLRHACERHLCFRNVNGENKYCRQLLDDVRRTTECFERLRPHLPSPRVDAKLTNRLRRLEEVRSFLVHERKSDAFFQTVSQVMEEARENPQEATALADYLQCVVYLMRDQPKPTAMATATGVPTDSTQRSGSGNHGESAPKRRFSLFRSRDAGPAHGSSASTAAGPSSAVGGGPDGAVCAEVEADPIFGVLVEQTRHIGDRRRRRNDTGDEDASMERLRPRDLSLMRRTFDGRHGLIRLVSLERQLVQSFVPLADILAAGASSADRTFGNSVLAASKGAVHGMASAMRHITSSLTGGRLTSPTLSSVGASVGSPTSSTGGGRLHTNLDEDVDDDDHDNDSSSDRVLAAEAPSGTAVDTMEVSRVHLTDMFKSGWRSSVDTYVVLAVGSVTQRTVVRYDDANPVYEGVFEFPVSRRHDVDMTVRIMSKGSVTHFGVDSLLGIATVPLQSLSAVSIVQQSYDVAWTASAEASYEQHCAQGHPAPRLHLTLRWVH